MEIRAEPWRKFGHDRTYLKGSDDAALGWVDNRTGVVTVEDQRHRDAIEVWLAARSAPGDEPAVVSPPGDAMPQQLTTCESRSEAIDLAENRPGQAVRSRANSEREAMREKSKFFTGVARILDLKTDERAWRVGADGEETIGAKLEKLTKRGWHVLHSVPIGSRGSDIDHLLIGPGGVWTINTKNHPGKQISVTKRTVFVDGHSQSYIRNSEFEADRVRSLLSAKLGWEPFVKSAIVFLTGTLVPDVTIKSPPEKVLILDRMDVPMFFKRSTGWLTEEQVATVFDTARRQSTWQGSA